MLQKTAPTSSSNGKTTPDKDPYDGRLTRMDVPKIEKDFLFLKWFLSLSTVMIVGFGAFLFNVAITNQTHIREALTEIKNIKTIDSQLEKQVMQVVDRFETLSVDPVHGWGQRWSRQEAFREIERQDKVLERFATNLERVQLQVSEIRIPMSRIEAEHGSMKSQMSSHLELPAHIHAGKMLILLQTKMEDLIQRLEAERVMSDSKIDPLDR